MAGKEAKKLMTSIQWLKDNDRQDVIDNIRKLENAWAKNGKGTRRCWKRVLLGTVGGESQKMSMDGRGSDTVEVESFRKNRSFIMRVWGGYDKLPEEYTKERAPKVKKAEAEPKPKKEKEDKPKKATKVAKEEKPKKVKKAKVEKAPKEKKPKKEKKSKKEKEPEQKPEKKKKSTTEKAKQAAVKEKVATAVQGKVTKKSKGVDKPSSASVLSSKQWKSESDIAKETGRGKRAVHQELEFLEQSGAAIGRNITGKKGLEWKLT